LSIQHIINDLAL